MISQSTRFSIGQQSSSGSPVQALHYATIATSPPRSTKHGPTEKNLQVNSASGRYVFIPQKDDTVRHRFRLRYSPCSDAYHREWDDCVLTRVGGNVRGWENGVYSFESVERVVDTKNNLVYLERTPGSSTGILTWKVDFSSCGLVVDQVSIKVVSHHLNAGEVLVMLSSGEIKKTISHMEGLGLVNVNGFENCKNIILSIHLIGETSEQQTRLFEKNILTKGDFPLDLKITLKPPSEMYNKPVILLGLMFSNSQETSVDRRHYRTHSSSSGRGFLHFNIVQAKNITSSKDSVPDAQVKCYLLPDDKNVKSCKTGRAKKSSSPIWDEYFVIHGVAQSQLRNKQLGIRVVNWHLGINKKNSQLGELRIGCSNVFDFRALASPDTAHGMTFRKEQSTNEGTIYSPLIRVDEERQKKINLGSSSHVTEKKTAGKNDSSTPDIVVLEKDQWRLDAKEKMEGPHDSSDEEWPENETNTLAENLKKLNGTGHYHDMINNDKSSNNVTSHVSDNEPEDTDEDVFINENNNKAEVDRPLNQTVVKPCRPPPPNRLQLNSFTANQDEDDNNLKIPFSPRKAHTPTLSRLMMKLPMSPRRGRRSSWGGESDLSLESPRGGSSTKSPTDYESFESRQWDLMINRPKQWIYCWQTLEVNLAE